jgi:hypothetical protein
LQRVLKVADVGADSGRIEADGSAVSLQNGTVGQVFFELAAQRRQGRRQRIARGFWFGVGPQQPT